MMTSKERFLAACRCEPVDRPPVWIMRQAGRYLPEYRELRAKHSFLDFCRKPELAREVALQPLRRFPLDAAILFSDILVVPEAMGIKVEYPEGGPQLAPKIDSAETLASLDQPDVEKALGYVGDAVEAIRDGIGPDLALIGFAGAPYTLANYMADGGSKHLSAVKLMAYRDRPLLDDLLDRLADIVIEYLRMQVARGADVVQLFDTWAAELGPREFIDIELPRVKRIIAGLADLGVPVIYYVNGVSSLFAPLSETGAQVQGLDWRVTLKEARRQLGDKVALQGNMDPLALFGPEAGIRRWVREAHEELGGVGHIFNLGHGIVPQAPIDGLAAFVDEVTRLGGEK